MNPNRSLSTTNTSTDDSTSQDFQVSVGHPKEGSDFSFTTDEGSLEDPEPDLEAVYDDVYSCEMEVSEVPQNEPEATPPVDRTTKTPKRRSLIRPFNEYENVVIHNLTESLKRKLVPRRITQMRGSKSSSSIGPLCENTPVKRDKKSEKKYNTVGYPGLKPKPKIHVNGTLKDTPATRRQVLTPATFEEDSSLPSRISCRSSGMEVYDNEIYQNGPIDVEEAI